MTTPAPKRHAQSPLEGEGSGNKKRNISDDPPPLVSLEEISDHDSQSDADSDLLAKSREDKDDGKQPSTLTADEKIDKLVDRMDRFFECFDKIQKSTKRQQKNNDRKFKHLESAHNELISKVVDSAEITNSRIDSLEERLLHSENVNKDLTDKIASLESNQDRNTATQHSINVETAKKMSSYEISLGYTDRNVLDLASEVKERKIIISRVYESRDEDVVTVAMECINKVINAAIADIHPDDSLEGLRILMPQAIDNVYRIGKFRPGRTRNISVTFPRKDDKEMVCRARAATKENDDIRFFISDDLTQDGRAAKAQLKRISTAAKSKGHDSKVTGNKVVINSRVYASNEIKLIPKEVTAGIKEEKSVNGGIAYRGDRSIFSNFFPAPFNLGGNDYNSSEQYYQFLKASHHGDDETAERILNLSNPWRIKVLGDSIEADDDWISKRMKVMYDAISAKFRQNWPLHDELLRTKGLKLYEATTDMYWACGIGYDSKKWESMDWKGENVSGLIVTKVREELLLESSGHTSDENTLRQIASDENTSGQIDMDLSQCLLESTLIQGEHHSQIKATPSDSPSSLRTHNSSRHPLYTDVIKSHRNMNDDYYPPYQRAHNTSYKRGSTRGGRGRSHSYYSSSTPSRYPRGNGRGRGRFPQRNGPAFDPRRPQERMSRGDRDFLYGHSTGPAHSSTSPDKDGYITPKKTVKSPKTDPQGATKTQGEQNYPNEFNLTERQRQGLMDLGLGPDSGFVRNISSITKLAPKS